MFVFSIMVMLAIFHRIGNVLTVDGYGYAPASLGVECGDLANQN